MLGEVTGLRLADWWRVAPIVCAAVGVVFGFLAVWDAARSWRERRRLRRLPPAEPAAVQSRSEEREVEAGDLIAPVRNGRVVGAALQVPPGWVEAARRVVRRGQWVVVGRVVDGRVVRREADQRKGEE